MKVLFVFSYLSQRISVVWALIITTVQNACMFSLCMCMFNVSAWFFIFGKWSLQNLSRNVYQSNLVWSCSMFMRVCLSPCFCIEETHIMLATIPGEEARDPGDQFSSSLSITQITCKELREHVHSREVEK